MPIVIHLYLNLNKNTVQQESLAGQKFGKFGESSVILQTKTIQINSYN